MRLVFGQGIMKRVMYGMLILGVVSLEVPSIVGFGVIISTTLTGVALNAQYLLPRISGVFMVLLFALQIWSQLYQPQYDLKFVLINAIKTKKIRFVFNHSYNSQSITT